jgi:hypothetical protein
LDALYIGCDIWLALLGDLPFPPSLPPLARQTVYGVQDSWREDSFRTLAFFLEFAPSSSALRFLLSSIGELYSQFPNEISPVFLSDFRQVTLLCAWRCCRSVRAGFRPRRVGVSPKDGPPRFRLDPRGMI